MKSDEHIDFHCLTHYCTGLPLGLVVIHPGTLVVLNAERVLVPKVTRKVSMKTSISLPDDLFLIFQLRRAPMTPMVISLGLTPYHYNLPSKVHVTL